MIYKRLLNLTQVSGTLGGVAVCFTCDALEMHLEDDKTRFIGYKLLESHGDISPDPEKLFYFHATGNIEIQDNYNSMKIVCGEARITLDALPGNAIIEDHVVACEEGSPLRVLHDQRQRLTLQLDRMQRNHEDCQNVESKAIMALIVSRLAKSVAWIEREIAKKEAK